MQPEVYVVDTSSILVDWRVIQSFKNSRVVIPLVVLEEVDTFKNSEGNKGFQSRSLIRFLDDLRTKGNLFDGVSKDSILYQIGSPISESTSNDNKILLTALALKKSEESVCLISQDLNLRVKASAHNIPAQSFDNEKIISGSSELYSGIRDVLVSDDIIEDIFDGQTIDIEEFSDDEFYPNQYLMLVSELKSSKTALAKVNHSAKSIKKIINLKDSIWGIKPRNREQNFAFDALLDDSPLVSLVGVAGSGKTLQSLAAGLYQTLETGKYKKLIVARPIQPMGKDIGYLPGSATEKLLPWLGPIQDNLEFLLNGKANLEMYVEDGKIEIEALTYIRGRSIPNAFFILDESQNITKHELKTILTRIGENSKIVLTGDIEQIDNSILNETNNGLSTCVEKFKHSELASHVTLHKGERSKLSSLAAKIL